jgi:5-hydroxyisourate hydrolase-like protein (transthyretin family)
VRWRDQFRVLDVTTVAHKTTHIELELCPPAEKVVHGVVTRRDGKPARGVAITVTADKQTSTVKTDANGRYTVKTVAGAQLTTGDTTAMVGHARVTDEQIDISSN